MAQQRIWGSMFCITVLNIAWELVSQSWSRPMCAISYIVHNQRAVTYYSACDPWYLIFLACLLILHVEIDISAKRLRCVACFPVCVFLISSAVKWYRSLGVNWLGMDNRNATPLYSNIFVADTCTEMDMLCSTFACRHMCNSVGRSRSHAAVTRWLQLSFCVALLARRKEVRGAAHADNTDRWALAQFAVWVLQNTHAKQHEHTRCYTRTCIRDSADHRFYTLHK